MGQPGIAEVFDAGRGCQHASVLPLQLVAVCLFDCPLSLVQAVVLARHQAPLVTGVLPIVSGKPQTHQPDFGNMEAKTGRRSLGSS